MRYFLISVLVILMSCNNEKQVDDHLQLNEKLEGKWIAKAFDGELHETWYLNKNGWMEQLVYYIENNDTTYQAQGRIEKINDAIVLMSIIKDGTPKIFKSKKFNNENLTFENTDYRNPYLVEYEFQGEDRYKRTITGKENDSLVVYTFEFKKTN